MVWQTSGPGPLPMMNQKTAVDCVISGALMAAKAEEDDLRKRRKLSAATKLNLLFDQKIFLQRVGQRLITSIYGLGACVGATPDNKYGRPWRLIDPAQLAQNRHAASVGVRPEGIDAPMVPLATIGQRKQALLKLVFGVEKWLRSGFHDGVAISPPNDSLKHRYQIDQAREVLANLMQQDLVDDLARRAQHGSAGGATANGVTIEQEISHSLATNLNMAAFSCALNDVKHLLIQGPSVHHSHGVGTYVVAPTQLSPCSECDCPVHVLPGVMYENSYAACSACCAKRCIECAEAFAAAMHAVTAPGPVGRRCRRCGAEPANVEFKTEKKADGTECLSVKIGERKVVRKPGHIEAVATGSPNAKKSFTPRRE